MSSRTALVRTRKLVLESMPRSRRRAARVVDAPMLTQADAQVAEHPHPLQQVLAEQEGAVVGLHRFDTERPGWRTPRRRSAYAIAWTSRRPRRPASSTTAVVLVLRQRQVALAAQHGAAAQARPEHRHHVAGGAGGFLGALVAGVRRGPARQQPVEPAGEERDRRELRGRHRHAVRAPGQAENVERFVETSFVLEEVGIGGEAQTKRRRGRRIGRHRVGDAAQVSRLRRLGREITQVPADRRNLPGETFLSFHTLEARQQPIDQTGDDVGAQR